MCTPLQDLHHELTPQQLLPIVHNYIHFIQSLDVSMRSNAINGMQVILSSLEDRIDNTTLAQYMHDKNEDSEDDLSKKNPADLSFAAVSDVSLALCVQQNTNLIFHIKIMYISVLLSLSCPYRNRCIYLGMCVCLCVMLYATIL